MRPGEPPGSLPAMLAEPAAATEDAPPLLLLLDGLVRRDGSAAGLEGEVQVGVRSPEGYRWWRARLGPRFSVGFVPEVSTTAHVTLCLGQGDAARLLATGRIPEDPELLHLDGDRALLERFLTRYTSRTNWLGVRLGR